MIQSRSLGLDVDSLRTDSSPADSEIGELICRNPFPSRPLGILGDEDGSRFHDAYFAANPGVWTHGDLITFDDDGQSRIHGRSDGVLNIQGVRIGPAEIYQALREVPEVEEALAVEQVREKGEPRLVLLVVPRKGSSLDGAVSSRIRRTIARQTTPLHVPQLILAIKELPRTHSGKCSERAAADAVSGREATNLEALANPGSLAEIRDALVAVNAPGGPSRSSPRRPDGGTEEELRAIWEELLGIEPIAGDEDFFALGGTSLLAVQLFLEIEKRLGPRLHLSTLLEASTIGELTALIGSPDRHGRQLVLMRPGSDPQPLFLVHSLWGDVLGLRDLTTAMKGGTPVYGLRVENDINTSWSGITVEGLAASYLGVIQAKQPLPPYRIAGHSFGALVAFEMARQLSELDAEVEWLGMIDGELNTACLPPLRRWGHRLALPYHLTRAAAEHPGRALRAIARTPLAKIRPNPRGSVLTPEALPEQVPDWMSDAAPYYQHMALSFMAAADAFRPRPYPGPMTYFVPQVRRFHLYADPVPVWKRVAPNDFELVPVPGPHIGMDSGLPATVIAPVIDDRLK
jgi:acetoacetyl-CoA synthetase